MVTTSRLLKLNSMAFSTKMSYVLIGIALGKFGNFSFIQIYRNSAVLSCIRY